MMKFHHIFSRLLVLIPMLFVEAMAQDPAPVSFTGTVTGIDNIPVAGMNVTVQERSKETVTDSEGKFSITAVKGDVLIFSKDDYLTYYHTIVNEKGALKILVSKTLPYAGMDDDVYIPFDIRKKREINGAVSSLKSSVLPQIPSSSLTNLFAGQLPGLNVWQTGTLPGRDETTIVIRNRASFAGANVPLVLVDGVVRDFSDMDLSEIEGISVLKDAASLAWYGNRAANGVLLITTKRGSADKTLFTYDTQMGTQQPTVLAKPLDSFTFGSLYNRALQTDGFAPLYSQETLDGYKSRTDPYKYPNNNFVEEFFKNNALVQRHVLTASGGSKAVRYFTNLSYFNQGGLYNHTDHPLFNTNAGYRRYNLRTNLDIQVTPLLTVQLDMGGRIEDRREPGSTSATFLSTVFDTPPNAFPLLNEDGSYGGSNLYRSNPLAQLQGQGNRSEVTRVLQGTINANHKLDFWLNGLTANLFYTFDIQGRYLSGRSQEYEVYERGTTGALTRFGTQTPLGYLASTFADNVRTNELWTGLDYDQNFGKHHFRITARYQQAVTFNPTRLEDKRQGFSGRVSYSFNNRYYADLVASYTGADNYMPGKQFGFFPAIAAGWVISEELFLKNTSFLDYLKIRASYGKAGNNSTGETNKFPYAYLFNPANGSYAFGTSYSAQAGASENTLPNPDMTWETAVKTDVGFDAQLVKNRLSISANYFNEYRKDILTNPIYPSIIGLATYRINDGETRLNGFEGAIDFTQKFGAFTIMLGGNFTYAKNKILRINESAGLADYQQQAGYNIGSVTGFGKLMLISEGIFQSQEEINNSPVQRFAGKLQPGDIKYKDVNSDGVVDNYDRVMTEYNDTPDTFYGFKIGASYKSVDFSLLAQGVAGRTVQLRTLVMAGSNNNGYINQFSPEAWTASNPSAPYPRLGISDRGNNTADSDFWLRSGNYLRLKSVELGYTLPSSLLEKIRIRRLRVYVNGFNLLNFNKTGINMDPEMPFAGYNSYPYVRTLTAGLNLKF
ncbi:SusC/RagA family TonB-linked outer membrane protein [Dyadobacter psychrotolerans]|uniref:TonB-dependent receptor n=1 Tax=Dyadobacter psychrotolerans TaxID=2541721 RepID=A0A4R5DXN6_9BACT|nr:TonB-dependent receptor [Dyadobacter psychrotolerans]TDE17424.1 TonB-dependent receptor [Dyadobacter psychrotolerans]